MEKQKNIVINKQKQQMTNSSDATENQGKSRKEIYILLLGAFACGKTTVYRQLRSDGFTRYDFEQVIPLIRESIVWTITALVAKSLLVLKGLASTDEMKSESNFNELKFMHYIEKDDKLIPQLEKAAILLNEYKQEPFVDERKLDFNSVKQLVVTIKLLWNINIIRQIYFQGSDLIRLRDNMDYFLDDVERIMSSDFVPTEQDVLRHRQRTIGMHFI